MTDDRRRNCWTCDFETGRLNLDDERICGWKGRTWDGSEWITVYCTEAEAMPTEETDAPCPGWKPKEDDDA